MLSILLENIREIDRQLTRGILTGNLLVAALILEVNAEVNEISLFGLKITNLSSIELILPPIISYLYFSCWTLVSGRRILEAVFDAFVKILYPELFRINLELQLRPPQSFKIYNGLAQWLPNRARFFTTSTMFPDFSVLIISVPVICAYVYYPHFLHRSYNWATVVSAAFSLACILKAYVSVTFAGRAARQLEEETSAAGVGT
jgi:hypothetical protein